MLKTNHIRLAGYAALAAVALMLSSLSYGQHFNRQNAWKYFRNEVTVYGGAANYLGELGGLDRAGFKWFLLDLELAATRQAFGASYRYQLSRSMAARGMFWYGKVFGSDALTGNPERNYRNLDFTSNIFEVSGVLEYYIIRNVPGHIYRIKGAKGMRAQPFDLYVFGGIGAFRFNPKSSSGVPLQPLGTEGQGLPGGPKKYRRISLAAPVGFGAEMLITNMIKIGIDLNYRFTLTDYLDDVSTVYYDASLLSPETAALADRSSGANPEWTATGAIRGNPKNNDSYMSAMLSSTFLIRKQRSNFSHGKRKHPFLKGRRGRKRR